MFYNEHHKAYNDDELVCHALTVIYQIVSEMQDYKARAYYSQPKYETFSRVYGYNDINTLNALHCMALDLYLVNRLFLITFAQFKKIVALSNLIQRIYHNDIRNMLP